ncbi:unnamed protein product [Agarophyton chilense]|eukprot:gb/GEZJ01000351.1/.p1 GENE.gb/GEZJ01000351.1/~~gb/GEZJ01000351.1/.p1  ORF type:complete len:897 (-),score=140.48 gb/GEZJ01000351.1/:5886-8576(-)
MATTTTDASTTAARVGKFLMLHTLGEGAFGKVRLAVDETTGMEYAIKIMDKSHIKANELTLQVRREIAVMKAMTHPNIVNLHAVLTSSKNLYMVMDLVTGGELFDAVAEQGRLPEPLARSYFQQLVDGIHYCHSRRVYHRDLKPENLLLTADKKTIKITDFGLSSIKAENASSELLHTIMGSPHYIAPEIITSAEQGYEGAKVDVWASGVILFGMLAGYLPFDEPATRALYRAIVHNPVVFPPHFSYDCIKLLRAMLQKDPTRRPTMEEVKTYQWFKADYQPALVEDVKLKTPDTSHRKKGKQKAKKSERHRHAKKKYVSGNSAARSENDLTSENISAPGSSSHELEYSSTNQFNTRSSIVVEVYSPSVDGSYDSQKHPSHSTSHQSEKENLDPKASFSTGRKHSPTNTANLPSRQPLMPLSTSANHANHVNQSHRQRGASVSADALEKHFDESAPCSTLYYVDDQFDQQDRSVNSAEDGAALRHSINSAEDGAVSHHFVNSGEVPQHSVNSAGDREVPQHSVDNLEDGANPQSSPTASHSGTYDSFDPHARFSEHFNSAATDKQLSSGQSQGADFLDIANNSTSSKIAPTSGHSGHTSLGNSSSCPEESETPTEPYSALFEPRALVRGGDEISKSHSSPLCTPRCTDVCERSEEALSSPLRVVDDAESEAAPEGQFHAISSPASHSLDKRNSSTQKPDLKGRLSDDKFEPSSTQAFISPVSLNLSTTEVPYYYAKTPTASRRLKFTLNEVDSPISDGSLFLKAKAETSDENAPRTDTSIFRPIKSRFEKLATVQTPELSQRKSGAPSVFSPQVDEDTDQKGDWSIDSVSVFADAETDNGSATFTPKSGTSVNTPDIRWKFRSVFGKASNKDEDSRKSIFAPLRLTISEKLSPSNK